MATGRDNSYEPIENFKLPFYKKGLEQSIMNEILQVFLLISDQDMYGEVLKIILRVTESRYGVFGYIDESGALVAPSITRDIWSKCEMPDKKICFPMETWGNSIWGRAITEKKSLWNNELRNLPLGHVEIKNVLVVPVIFRDNVIGMLKVAERDKGYGESEILLLENIAEFIAPVLFARLERDRLESKRVLAEQALRESESIFRRIVEFLPTAIFNHNKEEILFANSAAADLVSAVNPAQLYGKSLKEFLIPEYKELFLLKLNELKKKGGSNEKIMTKLLSLKGDIIDTELVLIPYLYQNEQAVHIVAYDLTRKNKIEEEIIKANKLESISLLAGGISHEFNNILAAVSGNISLSLKNMKQDDKNYKRLKNAEKSIEKAKELTVQIQTFARGGDPVKTTACIKEIIQEVIPFVVIGSNVQYRLHISDDLALVYVDAGQISQVINNLAVNALQAMPEGGLINISAENVLWGQEKDECACPLNYGEYVKVMIQDSGIGIDKRNFKKIFDPFFSTKIEGSGMGLATSYSIIKRNGGCIKVESEPGEGTVFSIYLPIASKNSCDVTN